MFKKIIPHLLLIITVLLSVAPAHAAIPVIDATAIAREAYYFALELEKWREYLQKWKDLERKFNFRLQNFLESVKGLTRLEAEKLVSNFFETIFFVNRWYWGDYFRQDIWWELYEKKKYKRIEEKYPALDPKRLEKLYRDTLLWKQSPEFRNVTAERLETYREQLKQKNNMLSMLTDFKEIAAMRKDRYDTFRQLLESWGSYDPNNPDGITANQGAKIDVLLCELMYENMLLENQGLTLIMAYLDNELKRTVMGMRQNVHDTERSMKAETEHHEYIK